MGRSEMIGTEVTGELLAGLVGRGIQLSRTPSMHVTEGGAQGLRTIYRLFDAAEFAEPAPDLAAVLRAAELSGFHGLNVTYPFKIEVMRHLDGLSANAEAMGAVNTVVFRDGRRIGHNTDLWGFAESFRRNMDGARRDRVLLIGAGGAGVAVAHALADCGVGDLSIFDREAPRASALARQVARSRPGLIVASTTSAEDAAAAGIDGIVNATPIGMAKTPGMPFPADHLRPEHWVADIVYFPLETELLATARQRGCRVLSGAGMAVFQAVRAFELFTGRKADPERMRAAFDAAA